MNSVELLSLAVVREYLSRKGYKQTLGLFDKESGKKNDSIQNRRVLGEQLKIVDLIKKNKNGGEKCFRSFLEMVTHYLIEDRNISPLMKRNSEEHTVKAPSSSLTIITDSNMSLDRKNSSSSSSPQRQRSNEITGTSKDILKNNETAPEATAATTNQQFSVSFIEGIRRKKQQAKSGKKVQSPMLLLDELNVDDHFDENAVSSSPKPSFHAQNIAAKKYIRIDDISLHTAIELKKVCFGNAKTSFNAEWRRQGFYFLKHPQLKYGLMQEKGGPCGLLASVQAWVLKYLLIDTQQEEETGRAFKALSPDTNEQTKALKQAFTEILSNTRHNNGEMVVALSSKPAKFNASSSVYKEDNLTEHLLLFIFDNTNNLSEFLDKNIHVFTKQDGLVLFLYSAILTHGIRNIRNSMDDPNGTLIGCHGYCTQEMVNLLLTGCAVSNVFDSTVMLDQTALHGIASQSPIGFLSLFEHYGSIQVGIHYKTPLYPIWVVCSESHFSVLFATEIATDERAVDDFDLFYFDGLGQQDEEIRLSITPDGLTEILDEELDLIPPLDSCIRTKWKNAKVNWNDSEPIL